jgi:hypothetical protein
VKWVLIYYALGMNWGFTGQVYFENRSLCDKAHTTLVRGPVRGVCVMAGETEN